MTRKEMYTAITAAGVALHPCNAADTAPTDENTMYYLTADELTGIYNDIAEKEALTMDYTIKHNEAFNSLEITFSGKPSEAVRDALKALRFRWHGVKKLWYGYASEDAVKAAIDGVNAGSTNNKPDSVKAACKAPGAPVKVNKFGVKVGDLFHASWGYDQTNNDFFQVVALVGETSVRVREVNPVCEDAQATCWAAEDRVFSTNTNGQLLPPAHFSVFIKDQEKGDLKRLKSYAADGVSNPQFNLSSYANAYYCGGDTIKVYESWYA